MNALAQASQTIENLDRATEWEKQRQELTKHFVMVEATVLGLSIGLASTGGASLDLWLKLALLSLSISLWIGCWTLHVSHVRLSDSDRFSHALNQVHVEAKRLMATGEIGPIRQARENLDHAEAAWGLFALRVVPEVAPESPQEVEALWSAALKSSVPADLLRSRRGLDAWFASWTGYQLLVKTFFASALLAFELTITEIVLRR